MSDVPELTRLVLEKIEILGEEGARAYFEVSAGTISAWRNGKNPPSLAAAQRVFYETLKYQAPEAIIAAAERPSLVLCLPQYESVEPLHFFSVFRCCKLYGMEKIAMIPKIRTLVDEARNDLAEKFLLTGAEWCLMIDSDIILPMGSAAMLRKQGFSLPDVKGNRNAIERIMSHPADKKIVGALYRDRRGMNKAQCEKGFSSATENARLLDLFAGKGTADGLEEQGWIGGGMLKIHRSVFLDMKEAAKPGGPLADIAPPKGRETEPYGFFGRTSQWRGEDVAFGRRAGILKIPSYLDAGILCGHRGGKIY